MINWPEAITSFPGPSPKGKASAINRLPFAFQEVWGREFWWDVHQHDQEAVKMNFAKEQSVIALHPSLLSGAKNESSREH